MEAAQEAIDAWVHGYNYSRPHQSLAMATPATLFRPAPIGVAPAVPVVTEPLVSETVDVLAPPRPRREAVLTPRARLLLPAEQQLKFPAALARREVTLYASARSIHILLDGAVNRTRRSRLSEHVLRGLLRRGARIAGPEPARGAVTVEMLTTSAVIEVARTISRDGRIGLGGHKVLLEAALVGQRVTVRFEGTLIARGGNGRLVRRCLHRCHRTNARR